MKKRVTSKVVAVLLMLILVVACVPQNISAVGLSPKAGRYVRIISEDGQFIHESRSVNSEKVGSLLHGYWRVIRAYEDGWLKVDIGSDASKGQGWIEYIPSYQDITTSAPTNTYTETRTKEIKVNIAGLKVHSAASLVSKAICELPKGATANVLSYNSTWVHIKFYQNGSMRTGYVVRKYVSMINKSKKRVPSDKWYKLSHKNVMARISSGNLKIHTSPSLTSTAFAGLPAGAQVKAVAKDKNKQWVEIKFCNAGAYRSGFVHATNVTFVKSNGTFKMSTKSTSIKKKATKLLYVKGIGSINQMVRITWTTGNKKIATVSKCGIVKGIRYGSTMIKAKVKVGGMSKTFTSKVRIK